MFGLDGWMSTRVHRVLAMGERSVHVPPASSVLYTPTPGHEGDQPGVSSPVAAYRIEPLLGAMASAPIARESSCDIIGSQVAPPFAVFQTPPFAPPAQTMFSVTGWIARALIRPFTLRGPTDVHSSGKSGQ